MPEVHNTLTKHFCPRPGGYFPWLGQPPMAPDSPPSQLLGFLPSQSQGNSHFALQAPCPLVEHGTKDGNRLIPSNPASSWAFLRSVGSTNPASQCASLCLPSARPSAALRSFAGLASSSSRSDTHPRAELFPSWLDTHQQLYLLLGASLSDCTYILNRFAKATIQRFGSAWLAFWNFVHSIGGFQASNLELLDVASFAEKLRVVPLWQV